MGSLVRRCTACRKAGAKYSAKSLDCGHPEAQWGIKYRIAGRQVFKTVGQNRRAAERHLLKIESEIACSGAFQEMKAVRFRDLADEWIKNYELSGTSKVGTVWAYRNRLKWYILPALGGMITNQITPHDLEQLKIKLREILSPRSTNSIIVQIGTILKHGLLLGYCRSNAAQLVKKFAVDNRVGRALSPEEAIKILSHASEPYKTILFTLLCTGLRIGEATALMWKDLDFQKNMISVERNVFHAPKNKYGMPNASWIFGKPKSKESTRRIPMIPALRTALLMHSERSGGNRHGLVFCTKAEQPYDRSTIRSKLYSILKKSGVKHTRLHDFRHTHSCWLLSNGAGLQFVSKLLGHSGVAITADIYHSILPREHERGVELMAGIFPIWDTTGIPKLPQPNESKRT